MGSGMPGFDPRLARIEHPDASRSLAANALLRLVCEGRATSKEAVECPTSRHRPAPRGSCSGRASARDAARATQPAIEIAIHHQLDAVEPEWRQFEQSADCTAFQAFDWLAAWCRHIGPLTRTQPAIVVGRDDGATLFILPLAVTPGAVRRLTWLGSDLCDYNGPLLAQGMRVAADARALPRPVAGDLPAVAVGSADPPRPRRTDQDAGAGRGAGQSVPRARGRTESEQRLRRRPVRDLDRILRDQAVLRDAAARPQQAQAARRNGRGAFRHAAGPRRDRALGRHADRAEGALVRAHGRRQHVRAAGLERVLRRGRDRRAHAPSGPRQPARRRIGLVRDQSRPGVPRHLLSRAGELRRRRDVALRAGRRASARPACAIRSSTGSSISISPSATSATSANGRTARCCSTTTWPPLRSAAGPPPPWCTATAA